MFMLTKSLSPQGGDRVPLERFSVFLFKNLLEVFRQEGHSLLDYLLRNSIGGLGKASDNGPDGIGVSSDGDGKANRAFEVGTLEEAGESLGQGAWTGLIEVVVSPDLVGAVEDLVIVCVDNEPFDPFHRPVVEQSPDGMGDADGSLYPFRVVVSAFRRHPRNLLGFLYGMVLE